MRSACSNCEFWGTRSVVQWKVHVIRLRDGYTLVSIRSRQTRMIHTHVMKVQNYYHCEMALILHHLSVRQRFRLFERLWPRIGESGPNIFFDRSGLSPISVCGIAVLLLQLCRVREYSLLVHPDSGSRVAGASRAQHRYSASPCSRNHASINKKNIFWIPAAMSWNWWLLCKTINFGFLCSHVLIYGVSFSTSLSACRWTKSFCSTSVVSGLRISQLQNQTTAQAQWLDQIFYPPARPSKRITTCPGELGEHWT